jgi:hypothetical protein
VNVGKLKNELLHKDEAMSKLAALFLLMTGWSACTAQETSPFAASDFGVITRDPVNPDRVRIRYEPRPRTWNGGRIFENKLPADQPLRIEIETPQDPFPTKPSKTRDDRMTSCFSTTLGPLTESIAWKQNGERLDLEQLWQLAEKPIRCVLLRDKPSDWNRLAEYAAYLDVNVVFIYPGPLLSAFERSRR